MKDLMIFKNEEFGEIRTLEINNEPWFVAKDICEILEIKNSRQALTRLDEDEKADVILNDGSQNRNMSAVNEYGLYNLILASRKKEAKEFKRWITHEVIPSIREHGGYIAGQEEMTDEELMAKAILMANSKMQELNHKNQQLEMQNSQLIVVNEIMKPKAEYFDDLVDRNLLTSFRETAKALGIKEKIFIRFLFEHKYIYRDKKGKIQPFADKNKELFEVKESKNEKTGWVGTQTLITPKGRETFRLLCVGL
jgi:prophage antirepressor-like protein